MPRILLIALLVLLTGCTTTTLEAPVALQRSESDAPAGERLIASPPPDWQPVYQVNNQSLRLTDFIPPDQKPDNWETKLSFESHNAAQLDFDPLDLLAIDTLSARKNCKATQEYNIHAGYENNYETAVHLLLCNENVNREMGEIALIKAIRGNEHYYVVRLIRRTPVFEQGEQTLEHEEIAIWSSYLSQIYVCDDSVEHPCSPSEDDQEDLP